MGQDDADLIRRWQGGDAAAFETLVRRWQTPIARFLARLVGRTDTAADLCQEVFLRFYLARDRYRETGTFSAWLYRVALNLARDESRRRRPAQSLSESEPAAYDSGAPDCERQELADVIARALDELPQPQREALVLRHYEGMSFEDMARLLGVAASTLKSRFAAALDRLRTRLARLGWKPEETP